MEKVTHFIVLAVLVATVMLAVPDQANARDYTAKRSGEWGEAKNWRPRGVPGKGDRVVSIGRYRMSVSGDFELGGTADGEAANSVSAMPALTIDQAGQLVLQPDSSLTLHGHILMSGETARIRLLAESKLWFAPPTSEPLQLQMLGSKQRIEFAGERGRRAEIALAKNAEQKKLAGHWFVASEGHRDSLLEGAYGRISDALDPATGKAWSMYLANDRESSNITARSIEFVNSGQIGVFGLDAGEFTTVDINSWTFKQSHPKAASVPALWFDGYGDIVATPPTNKSTKRIRGLVSDKEVYIRYVQDFELENWVIGANGKSSHVRAGNNGGNAIFQRDLFQIVRDSSGVGLVANTTENVYMYAEADNPHGFDTRHLRGDATLRNFWFESHFPNQSDAGDAILTNGPQSWVAEHGGQPVTLTIEHSGSIGDTSERPSHPVFLTLNNAEGMRFRLRHNLMRQPVRFNSVALDENGVTPTRTGLDFSYNLIFSPTPVEGYALGSVAGKQAAQPDVFGSIDNNLYFNLKPRSDGYPEGPHALTTTFDIDGQSRFVDPQLRDTSRNLAQWDLVLGGPGTAENAISEMLKANDDVGYNPAYRVGGLIAFVRSGFAPTNPALIDGAGMPTVGPALVPVPKSN